MSLHDAIQTLKNKRIFFGHQSVGANIIKGLEAINSEQNLGLSIQETLPDKIGSHGVFAHYKVGSNFDPASKNQDFIRYLDAMSSQHVDIAFYKYCYVDITQQTDIEAVLADYLSTLEQLKARYPGVIFLACTVPLTIVQHGPRVLIKQLIGRPIGGYADNQARNRFNTTLRERCHNHFPLFDLAGFEASKAGDAVRCHYRYQNTQYDALCEEYASDGRHLNLHGGKYIAEKLLETLARL